MDKDIFKISWEITINKKQEDNSLLLKLIIFNQIINITIINITIISILIINITLINIIIKYNHIIKTMIKPLKKLEKNYHNNK